MICADKPEQQMCDPSLVIMLWGYVAMLSAFSVFPVLFYLVRHLKPTSKAWHRESIVLVASLSAMCNVALLCYGAVVWAFGGYKETPPILHELLSSTCIVAALVTASFAILRCVLAFIMMLFRMVRGGSGQGNETDAL